jgi:Uma2 family endonuclease
MSTITETTSKPSEFPTEPARAERPRLEPGDHLSRSEFERRYEARPDIPKAELIEGVVCMPSPARYKKHGRKNRHVSNWLGDYEAATPGVEGADNCTVRLDLDNEPQPDHFLIIVPECGGKSRTSDDDYVEGAPELVVEVTASSDSYDLHSKKNAYRRNGVLEYVVVLTEEQRILWFRLHEGQYVDVAPDSQGIYRSTVFPGLWLDGTALLAGHLPRVKAVLQQGLGTPEHAAFVTKLSAAVKA